MVYIALSGIFIADLLFYSFFEEKYNADGGDYRDCGNNTDDDTRFAAASLIYFFFFLIRMNETTAAMTTTPAIIPMITPILEPLP